MGSWKQWSRAALTAAALAVVLDLLGAGRIQVTAYALSCPGLPEAFSGLKIALITDLHGAFLEMGGRPWPGPPLVQTSLPSPAICLTGTPIWSKSYRPFGPCAGWRLSITCPATTNGP